MATASLQKHTTRHVLRLRISHAGTSKFLSLGIKVNPSHWSTRKKRVTQGHAQARAINARLAEIEATAEQTIQSLELRRARLTASWLKEEIRNALEGEGESGYESFVAFAEDFVQGYKRRGQRGTWKSYKGVLSKFRSFLEHEGIEVLPFRRLTPSLIRQFHTWCIESRGNKATTAAKALRVLRTMTRAAMKEGYLEDYPFEHISISSTERSSRDHLTPAEIEEMRGVALPPESVIAEVRRWFLFSYFAGGMRFSDLATLRPEHITDGRIEYQMDKTQDRAGVPLTPGAKEILGFYDGAFAGGWLLPILRGVDPENQQAIHRRKQSQNAKGNQYLKKIARRAGLDKDVSFHLARNAAAWRLYQETRDIYLVSKWLNHASVEQTQRYLEKFSDDSADDQFLDAFS